MAKNLFSVPIFFIVFRETLEAAIIVSVLLGLAEQIVYEDGTQTGTTTVRTEDLSDKASNEGSRDVALPELANETVRNRRLIRKLRLQVSLIWEILHHF